MEAAQLVQDYEPEFVELAGVADAVEERPVERDDVLRTRMRHAPAERFGAEKIHYYRDVDLLRAKLARVV